MTDKSLRKEIKNFIWNNYSKDTIVLDSNVDKILKLIVKRIDSTLNLRKEEPDKKISDFFNGYLEALKDVKEMLK